MNVRPLVSVLLPCYNHAHFVRETLDSVAAQTFRYFELIIVDDASTDDSRRVIESWTREHPEIDARLVVHERKNGVSGAFKTALAHARGAYVAGAGSRRRVAAPWSGDARGGDENTTRGRGLRVRRC